MTSDIPRDAGELRRKAEEALKQRRHPSGSAPDQDNLRALVHELQVHQIELEMQNEALQQARDEAERTRDLFEQLYDHAPVAYFSLDPEGVILRTNLTAARLLDIPRQALVNRRLALFVAQDQRGLFLDLLNQAFAGKYTQRHELTIHPASGGDRVLQIEAGIHPMETAHCLLAGTDITAMVEDRRALRVAASVYEALDEAVMISDAHQRIVSVNPAFTRLTGYAAHETHDQSTGLIRAHREPEAFDEHLQRSLNTTGHWQGEIWHRHKSGGDYMAWAAIHLLKDDQCRPMRCITVFRDITEQRRAEEAIWRQANFDSLTGLPNRQLFQDRLRQGITRVRRHGQFLALLFLDLDKFKEVNDRFGHDVGDAVLVEAARRISRHVRKSDTIARLSGDEFTVIMGDLSGEAGVDDLAGKIITAMDQPFMVEGHELSLSASIGVAFCPADGVELKDLLRAADQAMYAAKQAGGRRLRHYSSQGNAALELRNALMSDLPGALEQGQFLLHFQPIIQLETKRTVMIEALLRWDHPERGMLHAGQFLGVAQECSLVRQIDQWVFQESLAVIKRLNAERGREQQPLQVAINESAHRFVDAQGVDAWKAQLESSGVAPESVVIEITERLLQEDGEQVYDWFAQVHGSGLKIALSQFGISRTGIPYLQRYPIDMLKIDHEFVQNMPNHATDQTIVTTLINMAHRLGLRVIAEGVETPAQRELLMAAGCDYAQGHLFGKPLPARELSASP
ncbi:putative bifunctional diguanylate cyclase/phosphodiesterase [Ectothiorhodospira marina]|uniref:PAS domain S-box-containing protein/diguanylate cyclase (GGDEF) domain-containing protein n=1 Tax=Ectothiorhodospira marina TaxID=1396821 RepID=A0A1H7NS00_9GAMM|nr:bifunctional diguanylate cyclase/phosphodiesterase [Ectothiorhodospira marina]SEL26186.1 PAS domain S-box-containing protein/diguanylate cyclase (GGDEF) domain-containing protein [Ectothiorhodospira marina]